MGERALVIDANRLGARGPWTPEVSGSKHIACPKRRAVSLLAQALEADLCWR